MFERVTLDLDLNHHPKVAETVQAARRWIDRKYNRGIGFASLILLAGQNGSTTGRGVGKTRIAQALLHTNCYGTTDGVLLGPLGSFMMANAAIEQLKPDVSPRLVLGKRPIVVLDEVGNEQRIEYVPNGEHVREMHNRWSRLVDYAYVNDISLIITSNLPRAALAQHLGMTAWSRLVRMCGGRQGVVDLTGVPDYRLTQVREELEEEE